MTWWTPDYEPSEHERQIATMFKYVDTGHRPPFRSSHTVIICFTNRSGSNYLAEAIASTGSVNVAHEYLNHPLVERRAEAQGFTSLNEYLQGLAEQVSEGMAFAFKVGLTQLYFIAELGFLDNLLPNPRFVLIEREDVLAQAISWTIASQTGQWRRKKKEKLKEPEYDFRAIDAQIDSILRANAAFKAFLARNGQDYFRVGYEELCSHPHQVVEAVSSALGFQNTVFNPSRIAVQPQATDLNSKWRERYLSEVVGS